MGEIKLYQKGDGDYPVTKNLMVKDVKQNKTIGKLNSDIIIASTCYPKIKERKSEDKVPMTGSDNELIKDDGNVILFEPRQIELRWHINKSLLDAGLINSWEEEDVEYLITSVLTDVLLDFSHLTTQEVGIAFRRGSREEYGKNYGISVRSYYSWLKTYCSQTKIEANKILLKLDVKKDVEPSEEEKRKIWNTWISSMYRDYDDFKKNGIYNLYDMDNMLYNLLKENGLIKFSDKERVEIWEEAKTQLKQRYNPLDTKNDSQRNSFFRMIEKIKSGDKSVEQKVSSQAKHIGLKIYLVNLSKNNQSLKQIIETKLLKVKKAVR